MITTRWFIENVAHGLVLKVSSIFGHILILKVA